MAHPDEQQHKLQTSLASQNRSQLHINVLKLLHKCNLLISGCQNMTTKTKIIITSGLQSNMRSQYAIKKKKTSAPEAEVLLKTVFKLDASGPTFFSSSICPVIIRLKHVEYDRN